ncbi:S8 family serine peptidase, partial [Acinetobacter portensis]
MSTDPNENGEINRIRAIQDAAKSGVINVFAAGNYNHYNEPGAYQGLPMVYEGLLPHYLTVANLISVRSDQIEIPEDSKVITTTKGYQLFEVEHQGEKYLRLVDLEEGAIDYLYKEVGSNIELTDIIVSDKATKEVLFAGSSQCGYTALWCVAAPGTGIYSSTFDKNVNNELVDNYENMTGTSMAAPHATGALAILMERFPYMTSSDVNNVLKTTTQDMDEQGAVKDGSSRVIDQYFGWGKIDLEKAIKGPAIFASSDDVKDMLADDVKQNLGNDLDRLAATFGNGDFTVNMGKGVVYDKGTPRQRTCDAKECEFDTWSNDITGSGGLIKNGSGVLQLTGTNTYKGETHINEGGLDLAGSLTSNLTINKAGILSGQGRAGNVNINDGKFIPSLYNANGLSTFTIHGDIKFTPDSTYTVKIKDESQQVDKLVVKGKAYLNKANFNMYEEKPDNLLTKNDVSRYQGNEYTLIDAEKIDQSFNDNYIKSITTDDVKPELEKVEQDKKLQLKFKDLAADKAAADKAAADKA